MFPRDTMSCSVCTWTRTTSVTRTLASSAPCSAAPVLSAPPSEACSRAWAHSASTHTDTWLPSGTTDSKNSNPPQILDTRHTWSLLISPVRKKLLILLEIPMLLFHVLVLTSLPNVTKTLRIQTSECPWRLQRQLRTIPRLSVSSTFQPQAQTPTPTAEDWELNGLASRKSKRYTQMWQSSDQHTFSICCTITPQLLVSGECNSKCSTKWIGVSKAWTHSANLCSLMMSLLPCWTASRWKRLLDKLTISEDPTY